MKPENVDVLKTCSRDDLHPQIRLEVEPQVRESNLAPADIHRNDFLNAVFSLGFKLRLRIKK